MTLNLLSLNSVLFFLLCTGKVVLGSVAPVLTGTIGVGVFARDENVSSLVHGTDYFLPTCFHTESGTLDLTLSKVNNGVIWAQAAVPQLPGRMLPSSPPLLQPYLTGQYECTSRSPGQAPSGDKYQLDVVGKKESWLKPKGGLRCPSIVACCGQEKDPYHSFITQFSWLTSHFSLEKSFNLLL